MQTESLVYFVEDLQLEKDLELGHVLFYGREEGHRRLDELVAKPGSYPFVRDLMEGKREQDVTIAEVQGDDAQSARRFLRQSTDVLLSLALRTNNSKHFGLFGLPGDLFHGREDTLHVNADWVGLAGRHVGNFKGFEMSGEEQEKLCESREYRYLHAALLKDARNEGEERALRGCWYFAKSVREVDDGISMLLASAAIEAWVLKEGEGKTFSSARAVAWFSCLGPDNLCGRDRKPCPYLLLDPSDDKDKKRLKKLKALHDDREAKKREAKKNPNSEIKLEADGWTCSQWSRGAKWYDLRSEVAHGRMSDDEDDGEEAEEERHNKRFWIATRVLNPVLNWLEEHPDTPASDLSEVLSNLAKPDNWDGIVGLINREDFSSPCPYES